jgi:hypothetical protein
MIDILKRIDFRLQGRSLLSIPEQLLADARDEIVKLRDEKKKLLNDVVKTIEEFKPYSPYIVGKIRIEERKQELIERIKMLV